MYSTDGPPFQATDRQYLIVSDDEDSINLSYSKGYTLRELVFTLPYNEFEADTWLDKDLMSNVEWQISESNSSVLCDYKTDCVPVIQDNNNLHRSEIDSLYSKTTQTFVCLHERGVNTSAVSNFKSTQTPDIQLSDYQNSTSVDEEDIKSIGSSPRIFPRDSYKQTNVDETDKSGASDEESSYQNSDILTYSLDNSRDSKSYYKEYNKCVCSSASCEDHRCVSDSDPELRKSSPVDTEPSSKANELILYLDQECARQTYLPNMKCHQGSRVTSWAYYKMFELKKFDEVIKSQSNRSDRRLKAISNKMCCKIEIIGPYYPRSSQTNGRNPTEMYRLIIYSNSQLRLEKSINCIHISFPNSYFSEKIYKSNQQFHG